MRPTIVDKVFAIADGLSQVIQLDADAPHNFVCCFPCNAAGDAANPMTGTVVYEISTLSCPYWVDIAANNDWTAPRDSSFQAPAEQVRVTISGQAAGATHFRVIGVQYHA